MKRHEHFDIGDKAGNNGQRAINFGFGRELEEQLRVNQAGGVSRGLTGGVSNILDLGAKLKLGKRIYFLELTEEKAMAFNSFIGCLVVLKK